MAFIDVIIENASELSMTVFLLIENLKALYYDFLWFIHLLINW